MQRAATQDMRVASRHMPRYEAPPAGPAAWLALGAAAIGLLYAAFEAPRETVAVFLLLLIAFLLSGRSLKRGEQKLRKLAMTREGESICEFAREFQLRSVDPWVVRATYEQLQAQLEHVHPAFPVRATDALQEDLQIDQDDLDLGLAMEIAQRTGRSLDNTSANPYFGKVRTVRDLVMFFDAQAKRDAA